MELVEKADAIILARVRAGKRDPETGDTLATLTPLAVLKGTELPGEVELDQAGLSNERIRAVASDPRNLVDANPQAFSGGCNRDVFDEDMNLVVFLKRDGEKLRVYAPPFSRALEDVPSEEALWVKAVKLYIQIAAFPKSKRKEAMRNVRDRLSLDIDDPDSRLLSLELSRALSQR